jgi:hypothetical protein
MNKLSNYPPGVSDSTHGAPWNDPPQLGDCYGCSRTKDVDDMSVDERRSYFDNDDDTFLCDECYNKHGGWVGRDG